MEIGKASSIKTRLKIESFSERHVVFFWQNCCQPSKTTCRTLCFIPNTKVMLLVRYDTASFPSGDNLHHQQQRCWAQGDLSRSPGRRSNIHSLAVALEHWDGGFLYATCSLGPVTSAVCEQRQGTKLLGLESAVQATPALCREWSWIALARLGGHNCTRCSCTNTC